MHCDGSESHGCEAQELASEDDDDPGSHDTAPMPGSSRLTAVGPDTAEPASIEQGAEVVPILGGTRQFYKLLAGIVEKHGGSPIATDSVFDFLQLVRQFRPAMAFVSVELLLAWNSAGPARLRTAVATGETRIIVFSELWSRDELLALPGIDRNDAISVPLSITHLESVIENSLA